MFNIIAQHINWQLTWFRRKTAFKIATKHAYLLTDVPLYSSMNAYFIVQLWHCTYTVKSRTVSSRPVYYSIFGGATNWDVLLFELYSICQICNLYIYLANVSLQWRFDPKYPVCGNTNILCYCIYKCKFIASKARIKRQK